MTGSGAQPSGTEAPHPRSTGDAAGTCTRVVSRGNRAQSQGATVLYQSATAAVSTLRQLPSGGGAPLAAQPAAAAAVRPTAKSMSHAVAAHSRHRRRGPPPQQGSAPHTGGLRGGAAFSRRPGATALRARGSTRRYT
jgi:hypothetical protein